MTAWSGKKFIDLNYLLADLFPLQADARSVAEQAGLRLARIEFSGKSITTWFNILEHARQQEKIDVLIAAALARYPESDALAQARDGAPPPAIFKETPENGWRGPTTDIQRERLRGEKSRLVSVRYLKLGLRRAKCVVRIALEDGGAATGFLFENNILVTNNHVIGNKKDARGAVIQFDYEETIDGRPSPIEERRLDPDLYWRTSESADWTAVSFADDMSGREALALKDVAVSVGDLVNIIQHPGGQLKQLSVVADTVAYVGDDVIQYMTDTMPGSSGSPVFNQNWDVVAVHVGHVTPRRAGPEFFRNQGVSIERVRRGMLSGEGSDSP